MSYPNFPFESQPARQPEKAADDFIDLENLLRIALRQAKAVIVCVAIAALLGVIYLQTTPPTYTSSARVLIDNRLGEIIEDVSPVSVNMQTDAEVLSQVEVVRSARLAGAVVDKLHLDQNEAFLYPPVSLFDRMLGRIRGLKDWVLPRASPPETASQSGSQDQARAEVDPRRQAAIQALQGGVHAERSGRSFVISITYKSHDPRLASSISNAYAEAYLADQLNASFDATEQATVWLQGRLDELRESSQAAALEVERYRAEHGLAAARGQLITDQQLAELTGQLIEAQADTARAQARYEQYRSIAEDGSPDAIEEAMANSVVPSELPQNSEIGALRTRYLNIVRRQRQIETDYGEDHPQAAALRHEASQVGGQIVGELRQLTQSFRNEYEVAQARETALRESLAQARGESSEANQSQVHLRELEQQASTLSSLYQTYLNRYERTQQQQTFPVARARIISEAATPRSPSSPRTIMVLGLSLVLGAMMGAGVGALNEFNERFFRSGSDVTDRFGLRFLGYLPLVGAAPAKKRWWAIGRFLRGPSDYEPATAPTPRARMRLTLDAPASMFAETLRNVKIAGDVMLQGAPCKVIGVISALPNEGKSVVASNLAYLLAANGTKTLLIDGDLRNPTLTRRLGIEADAGLVEALVDARSWQTMLRRDPKTGLTILPGVVRGQFSHTSETLSSPGMRRLIQDAKGLFQTIIVDLPPLGPVVDAKAFAPLVDGFVVVVEWGRTPRALVRSTIMSEAGVASKVLGVVINKVRLDQLPKYGAFGGSERYITKYASYYLEQPGAPEGGAGTPVRRKATAPADPSL